MEAISRAIKEAGGPSKVASLLGVSTQAVCFWRDGLRAFPPEHAATLEQAQDAITRREMFPNTWHVIWPELVTEEHPAPVTEQG